MLSDFVDVHPTKIHQNQENIKILTLSRDFLLSSQNITVKGRILILSGFQRDFVDVHPTKIHQNQGNIKILTLSCDFLLNHKTLQLKEGF